MIMKQICHEFNKGVNRCVVSCTDGLISHSVGKTCVLQKRSQILTECVRSKIKPLRIRRGCHVAGAFATTRKLTPQVNGLSSFQLEEHSS